VGHQWVLSDGGSTDQCSQSTSTGLIDSVKKRQRWQVGAGVKCHIVQELRPREVAHGALEPGHGQSRTANKRDGVSQRGRRVSRDGISDPNSWECHSCVAEKENVSL